jgi:hypothetical protein
MEEDSEMNDTQKAYREKRLVEIAMCFDISDEDKPRQFTIA